MRKKKICANCGDKYCCRGLCKEMNDYLIKGKQENKENKEQ